MPASLMPLYRVVGAAPESFLPDVIAAAIEQQATETADLDWKESLPPGKELPQKVLDEKLSPDAPRGSAAAAS